MRWQGRDPCEVIPRLRRAGLLLAAEGGFGLPWPPPEIERVPMQIRPRRSVLYIPGSNGRALLKAKSIAADALILDLEDAVAPEAKAMARSQVCDAIRAGGYGRRELIVRINALDSPWGRADLAAVAA